MIPYRMHMRIAGSSFSAERGFPTPLSYPAFATSWIRRTPNFTVEPPRSN